jgi:TIR domain
MAAGKLPEDPAELKLPILRAIDASSSRRAHKYTLLGQGEHQGELEQMLGLRFDRKDRQAAAQVFESLRISGLIASTMDDPIDPESWVELTEAGRTALQRGEIEKANRPLVYIIHAATDGPIAAVLKSELERLFPGVRTFVASKAGDIPTGADWLDEIHTNLRAAETYIVLLTPRSIERHWVWYESGAAWQSESRRLPVLAGGARGEPYPVSAWCRSSIAP